LSGPIESTDSQLVDATLAGSHEAYRTLVTRYQGHVYGLAYSIVGNWHDAQDIAQETFIRAYTNLDQLRDAARFAAWLRRVAFSITMAWVKAHRPALFRELDGKVDADVLEIPDFSPGPAETAEKRELADAVVAAVASLPPKYRVPLTMFHLDGLSYQKVADFLDIPLGTAKSLIARARAKLKQALASAVVEDLTPIVQEVFNEHKLPGEFAARVLEGVPSLRWEKTECTFAGAVLSCMQFLKEPFTYEFIMGVSGGAFRLFWCRKWCPSSGDLMLIGLEPAKRAFRALGYAWDWFGKNSTPGEKERFREIIAESIDRGRPVLATGIIGPSEHGVVAGYQEDALLGWSFFQEDAQGYYKKADWYEGAFDLLVVLGGKTRRPSQREILRGALEWAVELARLREFRAYGGGDYACGLNAYDEWAAALLRDEDFPAGDLETLTFRCNVNTSVVLANLRDARAAAAGFLRQMSDAAGPAAPEVLAAAQEYEREVTVVSKAMERAPLCFDSEARRREMADRSLREFLAGRALEAKALDARAVGHLEKVLETLRPKRSIAATPPAKQNERRK
jgi:RNA polymerase sigma factor (sigma-70 family)